MRMKSMIAGLMLSGLLPAGAAFAQSADSEEAFRQMAAALKADDTERRGAIETCIAQGIGDNPAGAAEFMGVTVEQAAEAWCTRMTNGIANGQLTLADISGLGNGTVTPNAQKVLVTPSEGK